MLYSKSLPASKNIFCFTEPLEFIPSYKQKRACVQKVVTGFNQKITSKQESTKIYERTY